MAISQYLSEFALGVNAQGILSAAKGGTGNTSGGGSTGPKISSVTVTDSSYNNLDDTAVALTGGYIKIAGSGFESGCQVLLGSTLATSVSYISSSEVRAQLPASSTGTYIIYLVNSDGGTAIRVNAVTFSPTPYWTTSAELSGASDTAISIQLAATDATSYALAAGSSLPSGISLSSGGLLSGTITGLSAGTTYNFTIVATDAELQDSTRAFTFDITVGEPYFKYVSLLLAGNGTNLAQNNTFIDSSTNNFAITRNGNTTQGTFSPYGPNWSNYFDGDGDTLGMTGSASTNFAGVDWTIETYVYASATPVDYQSIIQSKTGTNNWVAYLAISLMANGRIHCAINGTSYISTQTVAFNTWNHLAMVRSSGVVKLYINGVASSISVTSDVVNSNLSFWLGKIDNVDGGGGANGYLNYFKGYLSNTRFVKGTAVYTSNFTPSTTPLTAIANTSLLTCQSNRFIDNSTNAFTITTTGSPTVQRFSPFSPPQAYSTSTISGSGYFDGAGDHLSIPSNAVFQFGTGDFTIECWFYDTGTSDTYPGLISSANGWQTGSTALRFNNMGLSAKFSFYNNPTGDPIFASTNTFPSYQWCHVAVARSGTSLKMFVNGVQEASATVSASISLDTTTGVLIGSGFDGSSKIKGYVSNVRVVKGTAVYTSAFTPPTAPVTAIANTSLLANFTNAGIVDNAMQNNIETVGDAKISTTQYKFGSGSLYFDGAGDYCFLPKTDAFNFGSGDFTIELWSYISETYSRKYILGPGTANASHLSGFGLEIWNQQLSLWMSSNGTGWNMIESDTASNRGATFMAANTWYHIAVTRSGNTVRAFINGVVEKTFTVSGAVFFDPNIPYNIGRSGYDPAGYFHYNGYMDDFRVTRGYARYTTNFTPPTSALPLK